MLGLTGALLAGSDCSLRRDVCGTAYDMRLSRPGAPGPIINHCARAASPRASSDIRLMHMISGGCAAQPHGPQCHA